MILVNSEVAKITAFIRTQFTGARSSATHELTWHDMAFGRKVIIEWHTEDGVPTWLTITALINHETPQREHYGKWAAFTMAYGLPTSWHATAEE